MDKHFMLRAIKLARKGLGKVSPNPLVGAVIVKNGFILGEGYHQFYGDKHAEVNALESCLESAIDGTLYCNLEPCSYSYPGKKNLPCCDAIIKSGIKRVVIGQIDPNPNVSGSGIRKLKDHGIKVELGIMEEESLDLNCGFNTVMVLGRPYIHLKWAQTLDGQIATCTGVSKWISSEECRKNSHFYRSQCDGILVGRKTLERDNPTLDARYGHKPSPRPIIIDPMLKTSPTLNIYNRNPVIICSNETSLEKRSLYSGELLILQGRTFDMSIIMSSLKIFGFNSIFVEGGSSVITQCFKSDLWDRVTIYTSPKIMGFGLSPIGDLSVGHPKEAITFEKTEFEILDNHIVFNGYNHVGKLCLQE